MRRRRVLVAVLGLGAAVLSSCAGEPQDSGRETAGGVGTGSEGADEGSADQLFPDVLEAQLTRDGDEFTIAVTMSSPYDTPEQYADGWRVLTTEGEVLAEHELAHDHANEQPFTRSRGPFTIPEDVDEVVVEGRDLHNGYGGATVTVAVPR